MKKTKIVGFVLVVLFLSVICYLKKNIIVDEDYESYVYNLIIHWSDNTFINLVWLLPIFFNLYIIGKKYYFQMLYFDMRYHNRQNFINRKLIKCIYDGIFLNTFLFFFQIIILTVLEKQNPCITTNLFVFFLQYIMENVGISLFLILLAFLLKSFIYSVLINIILLILGLSLFPSLKYFPFLNLYSGIHFSILTPFCILLCIFLIKNLYQKEDIGGDE